MAGFQYSEPDPETMPLPSDAFYERKARQHGEKMAKRIQEKPLAPIPTLHEAFLANDAARAEKERAHKAELAASPYAFDGRDLAMTPQDRAKWKAEFFNEQADGQTSSL